MDDPRKCPQSVSQFRVDMVERALNRSIANKIYAIVTNEIPALSIFGKSKEFCPSLHNQAQIAISSLSLIFELYVFC
jgi:hypothetical protein